MKKFIGKTILFTIGLIVTLYLIIYCSNLFLNYSFNDKNAIFIWGDSQAYQGIDVEELSKTINNSVYTSAHHGAGVYDFLLFTQRVPENSEVIVSISNLVQIRKKENDFNRSGLSWWSLKKLYENNYSLSDIISITKLNLRPRKAIEKTTNLYQFSDSMLVHIPLSHYKNNFKKIPTFLEDKQKLYLAGIKNLISKNCKISFIEFPFHKDLENIENHSPIKQETEEFKHKIASLFTNYKTDSIKLNKNKNIFRDLTHLNCVGAKDLSKKLGINLINHEYTTMYITY